MPRTKIVCTIGPASEDEGTLRALIRAGMDVARINFSHENHAIHARRIELLRRLAHEEGRLIALLGDLQGPKIRLGEVPGGELKLAKGERLTLVPDLRGVDTQEISVPHPEFFVAAQQGMRLWLGDGQIELQLVEASPERLVTEVVAGGLVHSRQGIAAPGIDLGIDPLTEKDLRDLEFALVQKELIRRANRAAIPVITATQMLESMLERPRPTRAEASEVANAILDGTDAVMLSGETAVGRHPLEAARVMAEIAVAAERHLAYREWPSPPSGGEGVTDAVSQACCRMAQELAAKVILTTTSSGYTARMVARHRPATPILAVTSREGTYRRLALVWGVEPLLVERPANTDELIAHSVQAVQQRGIARAGDILVITAGVPHGLPGHTNMIKVHVVGEPA
ncbi:MAG: pyruvate kinase [Chloroflexi bacterium]|nr:pyruvate kinase [Chloroflexota bacterium]